MWVRFVQIGFWSPEVEGEGEGGGDWRVWAARIPGYVAGILRRIRERETFDSSNMRMRVRAWT